MSSGDDFQVVPEEQDESQADVMENLRELVCLFHSSVDALNQSTILLKDELQNALSLALQRVDPGEPSKTEELLKSFNTALTTTDEVRKNYVRRLCTKLVSLESEKRELEAECVRLKGGTYLECEKIPFDDQMGAVANTLAEISSIVAQLEDKSLSEALVTGPSDMMGQPTLQTIHTSLIDIRDRLSNLNLSPGQRCETKADDNDSSEVVKRDADDVKAEKPVKDTKSKEVTKEQPKPSADKRQVDPLHELFQRKLALALEECYPDLPSPGKPNSERDPSEGAKNNRKVKFKETQENTGDEEADDKRESPSHEGPNCYIQFRGPTSYFRYFRYGAPYSMGDPRWSRGAHPPDGYPYMPFQPPPPPFGPHQRMFGGPRPPFPEFGNYGSGHVAGVPWAGGGRGNRPPRPTSKTRHEERPRLWIPDFGHE
ncbi:hypothetical protein CRM22_001360 [Opisthorchis felineus]|uniref:Uncharacterized protein n=1 Tax=Opisthorchis felineus TaxID=147828 RepID=A0A4V3SGU7_OPIFE|nr:hypothetical protein CRM22_001360 [Opisthorchis felineus]TGZ73704.1 hypothetical protein CRM22_001360 [Opisthorchis felineus]TGZ73705.1 hypothetical protein CRM22_001360 [Opisthorchis felineus]TGZ73706.1 hypothetical protein CRM22_001360 [Opisthorchis felineus]